MQRRRDRKGDEGFTIVEVMVAMSVFAVLATAFAATLSASLRSLSSSKARTQAEQLASSQLEEMRRVAYDDLGTVGGNPTGIVTPTKTVTSGSQTLTVATKISYVNDKVPTAKETGADYKSVVVTVTSETSTVLAKESTLIAPPNQASQTDGLMKVQVTDYVLNTVIPNATVTLGTGPDAPISDITDANGKVAFAALTPTPATGATSTYTLDVTASGYQTLPDDKPPSTAAKTALATGQVYSTVIRLFKPVTMNLKLVTTTGTPFTAASTLNVAWSTGADSTSVSNGAALLTSVGSSALVPKVAYTVGASSPGFYATAQTVTMTPSYPSVLTTDVTLVMKPYTTGTLQATVKDSAGVAINGLDVVLTGGPGSVALTGLSNTSGLVSFTVPLGSTPVYTISVPTQSPYASASTTKAGPTNATAVTVTLTVPKL